MEDEIDVFESFRQFLLQRPVNGTGVELNRLRDFATLFKIPFKENGIVKGRSQLVEDIFLNPEAVTYILQNLPSN